MGLFASANPIILFIFYWFALMSIMAFSFALHTFFNKARTGGIVSAILFLSNFMIWASVKGPSVPSGAKTLVSFLPGVAFCFGIELLGLFEGAGDGVDFDTLGTKINGHTFGMSLFMLILDTAIFTVLGWWLELVLPKEFGTRRKPCFCIRSCLTNTRTSEASTTQTVDLIEATYASDNIED